MFMRYLFSGKTLRLTPPLSTSARIFHRLELVHRSIPGTSFGSAEEENQSRHKLSNYPQEVPLHSGYAGGGTGQQRCTCTQKYNNRQWQKPLEAQVCQSPNDLTDDNHVHPQSARCLEPLRKAYLMVPMETELDTFLAPEGSTLGGVTQRVLSFLSIQDLIDVACAANQPNVTGERRENVDCGRENEDISSRRESTSMCRAGGGTEGYRPDFPRQTTFTNLPGGGVPPAEAIPPNYSDCKSSSGGDEAGGSSLAAVPDRSKAPQPPEAQARENEGDREGGSSNESSLKVRQNRASAPAGGHVGISGRGIEVSVFDDNEHRRASDGERPKKRATHGNGQGEEDVNLLRLLVGLGLKPWAAFGAIRDGLAQVLHGVPLLGLLQWAAGASSSILGMTFRVTLLPYDITKGVVGYVMGSVEAVLNVANEIWCELRHLSLGELAMVVSCVLRGNALPEFLFNPRDVAEDARISRGGVSGSGNTARTLPFSLRETNSTRTSNTIEEPAEENGFAADCFKGGRTLRNIRGLENSDESRRTLGDSGVAWRQAHAMRRRLDRVNQTASLVSYEEQAGSAVSMAKAQRVRRRMHYAMPLQCFQATVTACGRHSPTNSIIREDDDNDVQGGSSSRRTSAEGSGSVGSFICTPQSFPPTPVSRAHVMARTSRFSDDILFLARDQLRLGENLKPGVDKTTRATADFLLGQRRLAVLDGNDASEDIILTCGQHRATKVGRSLYSSARAMVPVLRNRYVYFQASCDRDGALPPSVVIGLSTPEMPLSTLVGAFSNSIGLCSTGQVIMSSRRYGAPGEYALSKAGVSTVGVLVYLDGSRSFRSWDGDMVKALVCFSVDGRLVRVANGLVRSPPYVYPRGPVVKQAPVRPRTPHVHRQQQRQRTSPVFGSPPPPPPPSSPMASGQQSPIIAVTGTPSSLAEGEAEAWSSSSPSSAPPDEEVAPWDFAAASAAAAATASASAATPSAPLPCAHGEHLVSSAAEGFRGAGLSGRTPVMSAVSSPQAGAVDPLSRPGMTAPAPVASRVSAVLGLALPRDRDLFPTITMHSANTEVLCRFCAEDMLPVSRESIGAPQGVPVYALDGSLIQFV